MTTFEDSYDPSQIEERWRSAWEADDIYRYEPSSAPSYIIDTPPPYPTGNLHIGNALNWVYIDFAARYHRLRGDDVLFPQGWDCHGLPTEVKVEENNDIHRTEVPRDEFRQLCVEHTDTQIARMRETMSDLGFSIDWSAEYHTMDRSYWEKTQRSFVDMHTDEWVYCDEHPVNWCPRCETAIADAEVETDAREGTLHYVTFPGVGNDDIEIATTRPELLAACVSMAVDPEDERYADRIGDTFEVPLFGQEVELLGDAAVDGDFGTGAVMICTFGDKQDVTWWAEYDLDLRPVFAEDGTLTTEAGEYAGLTIPEAKEAVARDLEAAGYRTKTTPTDQNVGVCWRCDTPIEILSKEQWFIEVDKERILDRAQDVSWIPEHMYTRLEEWTEGMDWDWVISRQRVFATPIPAWFCRSCETPSVASSAELPVNPLEDDPAIDACPECGGTDWEPETDVMDTWMDSSISALHVAGWPDETFSPVALRPQGHDIIRTWAFYTILRTDALCETHPWEEILINGMVLGEDGNKMSKSRGNVVSPDEVLDEYSADAFRQAIALGGQPGSDVQFQWKEVKSADRFLTKIWNIAKFASTHIDDDTPTIETPAYRSVDRWLLWRLDTVIESVEAAMEQYRYDEALRTLRSFIWNDIADDYLELVKGRLYEGRPGERDAARYTLYTAFSASLRMLAPFVPFISEEIWQAFPTPEKSVHLAEWPEPPTIPREDHEIGSFTVAVAEAVRAWKSDEGVPLNAELERVELYPSIDLGEDEAIDTYDLSNAVNAPVYIRDGTPNVELVPVSVDVDKRIIGPEFREQAGAVTEALLSADPEEIARQQRIDGEINIQADGEAVTVSADAVTVTEEQQADGDEVELLTLDSGTVLVVP